jgi:hypothetical protein
MTPCFSIRATGDDITPDLRKKLKALQIPTRRAFRDTALRIFPSKAKGGGSPGNLISGR